MVAFEREERTMRSPIHSTRYSLVHLLAGQVWTMSVMMTGFWYLSYLLVESGEQGEGHRQSEVQKKDMNGTGIK
jgi:hypothetical protein